MREIRSFFTPILVLSFLMNVNSQTKTWVLVTKETKEIAKNELTFRKHFPSKSEIYSLKYSDFEKRIVDKSKKGNKTIQLPTKNGLQYFIIRESAALAKELSLKYPMIKSYIGKAINDPTLTARFSLGTDGLHTVIYTAGGTTFYIDPYTKTFDWDDLGSSQNNNISYTIVIATNRNLTDIVENRTITMSEITLTLEKALAYYWKVTTTNATNNKKTSSETFSFYTQGEGIVNYAPFISELVSPSENSLVDQGSINLSWIGSDADPDDTLIYELSFSEIFPPAVIEESLSEETYTVLVESAKTYYWKVNTIDQDGAKSIGQVWSFTVN